MNHPVTMLPTWIRGKVLEQVTGITLDAQKHKRAQGQWLEGVHWTMAPDGNVMYNWRAIDEWVEHGPRLKAVN